MSEPVSFCMSIAGVTFSVDALCQSTADYCKDYFCPESEAAYHIVMDREYIEEEYRIAVFNGEISHITPAPFTLEYYESVALRRKVSELLPQNDVLPFHGSSVSYRGNGIIFAAPSGTGKSTHSAFWKECFGDDVEYINDDKPYLRFEDGAVYVCGAPWRGKHRRGNNITVPLYAVCFIERSDENYVTPIKGAEVFARLMRQSSFPAEAEQGVMRFDLLKELTERTRFFKVGCTYDISAARTCRDELFG